PERDTAATVKVLTALLFFPVWHAVATGLLWHFLGPSTAFVVAGLAPFAGMTTRWFFRGRKRALRDATVFLSLLARRGLDKKLEEERDLLVTEIDALGKLVEELREPVPT